MTKSYSYYVSNKQGKFKTKYLSLAFIKTNTQKDTKRKCKYLPKSVPTGFPQNKKKGPFDIWFEKENLWACVVK